MRIPFSKLHRGFPELDRFSDEQCLRYIAAAQRGRIGTVIFGVLLALAAFLAGPILLAFLARFVFVSIPATQACLRWFGDLGPVVALILGITSGAIPSLLVRDAVIRILVRKQILGTRCRTCEYSFLGLPLTFSPDGQPEVRCPECGNSSNLRELDISIEEIQVLAETTNQPSHPPRSSRRL